MPAPTPPSPACRPTCPLCGGPNHCDLAATGTFDTPCWCANVTFSPTLLTHIPAADRNQVCLCPHCAVDNAQVPTPPATVPLADESL